MPKFFCEITTYPAVNSALFVIKIGSFIYRCNCLMPNVGVNTDPETAITIESDPVFQLNIVTREG